MWYLVNVKMYTVISAIIPTLIGNNRLWHGVTGLRE